MTLPVLTAVPRLVAGIHPCARALATMVVRTLLRWPAGTAAAAAGAVVNGSRRPCHGVWCAQVV